jgi:hypothetical protein
MRGNNRGGVCRGATALAVVCLAVLVQSSAASAQTEVKIAPADVPDLGNCYPFGMGGDDMSEGPWTPYMTFVYKNVPPFNLEPGTPISFDLYVVNDVDIELDIWLAATTVNGGDVPAAPFTKVVANSQSATNPRGNVLIGDFELSFDAVAGFDFPGGGLIIRFSNPSAGYLGDITCTQVLVGAGASDSSGFFVERSLADPDGAPPWDNLDTTSIGAFQVTDTRPTPVSCAGLAATLTGTNGAEVLRGTPGADVIAALGGADRVISGRGRDRACGGPGNDRLRGGPGRDLLKGGPGRDRLRGGPGLDKLRGGPGRDSLLQ